VETPAVLCAGLMMAAGGSGRAPLFGEGERFTAIGTREPSGIVYHPGLGHLFLVGDEGKLVELDKTPSVIRTHRIKGNLEDVTLHPPSGQLLILAEGTSELIGYDPVAKTETRRWRLDSATLLADEDVDGERSHGFEGLGFRPVAGFPGGGIFYLARQRAPSAMVGFAFDPATAPAGPLAPRVVSRWPLSKSNLKSAFFVTAIQRFLVLSKKGLTIVRVDGRTEGTLEIPAEQPEGVCLDDEGTMWIADDRGRALLRFPGALAALEKRVGGKAGGKPPTSRTPP
jgi:uncharacterized protein YjiK